MSSPPLKRPKHSEPKPEPASPPAEQLESLKNAIVYRPPYCSGTVEPPVEGLKLYYGGPTDARCIDFTAPTDEGLQHLAQTCDIATFGVNDQEVNDESYRKAGKLDTSQFCSNFNIYESGLLSIMHDRFMEGASSSVEIRPELYKLNVYGPGGFFKAHKDTPRGTTMFGSLVLVLPTAHEGGALVIRDNDEEWTYDSARILAERTSPGAPSIGYVAFFSDVEHEVMPVTSGYRVTLTYNLYNDTPAVPRPVLSDPSVSAFKLAMETALADPAFLPDGGYLAFGLRRAYPLDKSDYKLTSLHGSLKGGDAVVKQVCTELSLDAVPNLVFREESRRGSATVFCDVLPCLEDYQFERGYTPTLRINYNAKQSGKDIHVVWVTDETNFTSFSTTFTAFGNEPSLGFAYGYACLLVELGPQTSRQTLGNALEKRRLFEEQEAADKAWLEEEEKREKEKRMRRRAEAQAAREAKEKAAAKKEAAVHTALVEGGELTSSSLTSL